MRINSSYFLNYEKIYVSKQTDIAVCSIMPGEYSGKFWQRQSKFQLPSDNLGELKVMESPLFRLSKSLKSKIFTSMVLPSEYTGFIRNFQYWATLRLERMPPFSLFLTCLPFFVTPNLPALIQVFFQTLVPWIHKSLFLYIQVFSSRLTVTFRVIHGCVKPKLERMRPLLQMRVETYIFFMSPDSRLEHQHCNNPLNQKSRENIDKKLEEKVKGR